MALVAGAIVIGLVVFALGFAAAISERYRIAEPPEAKLPEVPLTVTPPLGPSGPAEILFSDAGDPKP